jgi:hypothetical protein
MVLVAAANPGLRRPVYNRQTVEFHRALPAGLTRGTLNIGILEAPQAREQALHAFSAGHHTDRRVVTLG